MEWWYIPGDTGVLVFVYPFVDDGSDEPGVK